MELEWNKVNKQSSVLIQAIFLIPCTVMSPPETMKSVVGSQKKQTQKGHRYAINGEMRERGFMFSCENISKFYGK